MSFFEFKVVFLDKQLSAMLIFLCIEFLLSPAVLKSCKIPLVFRILPLQDSGGNISRVIAWQIKSLKYFKTHSKTLLTCETRIIEFACYFHSFYDNEV